MTRVDSARRRATVRRILGAGAVALMVSTLLTGSSSAEHDTGHFSNTTAIVIPAPGPPSTCPPEEGEPPENACPSTPAVPYPSNITVAGLTGTITDVNVTLSGLTHVSPADLDVMLESPDGKTVMLMSDACGDDEGNEAIASAITLTFDDQAGAALPADSACTSGTFRPVDDEDDGEFMFTGPDNFPNPPTGDPAPASASSTSLATFNAIDPNGTWSLWVVDDTPHTPESQGGTSPGQFSGGWSLDILTTTSPTTTSTTAATTTSTTTGGTTTTTQGTGTTTTITTTAGATTTTLDGGGGGGATTTTTSAGATTTSTSVAGPTLVLSQTTVSPGDTVVVTGTGMPANTPVQLNFLSDPVRVGAVTTNAAGSFQTTVTIPSNATAGAHQINATDSAGRVLAVANLTVVRSAAGTGTLARTGYSVQAMIVLATGLILLGYLFCSSASAPVSTSPRRRDCW